MEKPYLPTLPAAERKDSDNAVIKMDNEKFMRVEPAYRRLGFHGRQYRQMSITTTEMNISPLTSTT